jgi:hypothetical protein
MNKKTLVLVAVALLLGAISLFLWLDSRPETKIQIASRIVRAGAGTVVVFLLDSPYPMTRIKVTSVEEGKTNSHPHAVWDVVADPKPVKKTEFVYGENIAGMKPFLPGMTPEPLEPNAKYLLVVTLGKNLRGECVFDAPATASR